MRLLRSTVLMLALAVVAAPVLAQLGLPGPGLPGLPVPSAPLLDAPLGAARDVLDGSAREVARTLEQARVLRIDRLIRSHPESIERDGDGQPARRGVLLLLDPDPAVLEAARALGFVPRASERIEGIDIPVAELGLPEGLSLAAAQALAKSRLGGAQIVSDPIHFQAGAIARPAGSGRGGASPGVQEVRTPVGIIDGAPAQPVAAVRGFAAGAPLASNHGSAVADLAARAGVRTILVADVYGSDPAGGSALAITRGLGWLVARGVKVVSISLVGPPNLLLERALAAARARGVIVLAAVGNDGPASPPAYPASYPGVLAITGVDARNRPLIEAGHAAHLDYAAPGAGLTARDRTGRPARVRGTSFAAPLAAARAAAALDADPAAGRVEAKLDAEAQPLSNRRPDPQTGRGLLCARCR